MLIGCFIEGCLIDCCLLCLTNVSYVLQAIKAGFAATDASLREECKREGCMATVAFVCGRQLVVATAGNPLARLDTGGSKVETVRKSCLATCCMCPVMRELARLARPLFVLHHVKVAACHCLLIAETAYSIVTSCHCHVTLCYVTLQHIIWQSMALGFGTHSLVMLRLLLPSWHC